MERKTGKKREAPISYRPPVALRGEFFARVQKSGLSTSAFITKAIFDRQPPRQARRPGDQAQLLARLLARAGELKDIHERARCAGGDPDAVERELADGDRLLSEIRAAVLKATGRKP